MSVPLWIKVMYDAGMDSTIEGSESGAKTPHSQSVPLEFNTELFSSGLNGALRRWPNVDTQTHSLFDKRAALTPSWKPHWSRVPTVGLTFPLGFELDRKSVV